MFLLSNPKPSVVVGRKRLLAYDVVEVGVHANVCVGKNVLDEISAYVVCNNAPQKIALCSWCRTSRFIG